MKVETGSLLDKKYAKTLVIVVGLAFSTVYASSLSKSCIEEFIKLPEMKADFDMVTFMKDLPPEVIKIKAQSKLPFGKPADSKMTDIGITVGCLKQFPESVGEITPMLKDLSVEMAKNAVAGESGVAGNSGADVKSGFQSSSEKRVVKTTDVVYLRNGQEVKDAVVIRIGVDEVEYKVGTRAAVYAVKKTDISAILHSDGAKEFFCNGTSYNFETHFCHTDAQTYSCGNKPYNPATQSCHNNNQILNECRNAYNPLTHFCHADGQTYSCSNKPYNPVTQFCYNNNQVLNKCNGKDYNPATYFCHTDGKTYSCDGKPYNPATHFCDIYGRTFSCGGKPYNPATHLCKGQTYSCGNKPYNPKTHFCHTDGQIYSCDDEPYNPATHFCHKDGKTYSCGNKPYNPATHFCHKDGKTYSCGNKPYNPTTHACQKQ
ncbi:MAG: hypothetical protein FWB90_10305 [Fibromonadales bacterium]|nr:hypothetical protein [Fibromonadales bacterium]